MEETYLFADVAPDQSSDAPEGYADGYAPDVYDAVMSRIEAVTHTRTQAGLAAALGITQSSISDAKRRGTIPMEWYLRLFDTHGANPDWLKKGTGPTFLRTEAGYACNDHLQATPYGVVVTVYHPGCDPGVNTRPQLSPHRQLAIPAHYALSGLLVLIVPNDALAPLVRKGAYVGIDTHTTHPRSGEVFAALAPHEGVVLRRLFLVDAEPRMVLRADNPAYPEIRISPEACEHRLIGRLGWIMQTV